MKRILGIIALLISSGLSAAQVESGLFSLNDSRPFVHIAPFSLPDGAVKHFKLPSNKALLVTDFINQRLLVFTLKSPGVYQGGNCLLCNDRRYSFHFKQNNEVYWLEGETISRLSKASFASQAVSFNNAEVSLNGEIWLPQKNKQNTLVIFSHGSGARAGSRDDKAAWASYLTFHGFTTLRFDKRGVGKSSGDFQSVGLETLAEDLNKAVDFIKQSQQFNDYKIVLFGSSQGGMLANISAAKNKNIDGIVNLYGNAIPVHEQDFFDRINQLKKLNLAAEEFKQAVEFQRLALNFLINKTDYESYQLAVKRNEKKAWFKHTINSLTKESPSSGWAKKLRHNPENYVPSITQPYLYMVGSFDLNQPGRETAEKMKQMLKSNPFADVRLVEKAHHGLMMGKTGKPDERDSLFRYNKDLFEDVKYWLETLNNQF